MSLIRGEYFPSLANKVLIHYDQLYCNPHTISDGNIVYCDTHQILRFKEILNQKKNLTIITHNSDHYLCDEDSWSDNGIDVEEFTCYQKWYGQNSYSSKVIPLPIGFENKRWEASFGPKTDWLNSVSNENIDPTSVVYLNCNRNTNLKERQECYDIAHQMSFVTVDDPNLHYIEYLKKIKQHMFVLSPRGNGLDCHRTWEILMMKRVPILKREGKLENLYANMPVVFVDDWSDIHNMNFKKIFKSFSFDNQEYLEIDFWKNKIQLLC